MAAGLEFQHFKSGIPTVTPYKLTPVFPVLPPILYMKYQNSILSYSEAPWGPFRLVAGTGIFTGTTISPGGVVENSAQIVTPFVRVRTYLTRNFATLGPL